MRMEKCSALKRLAEINKMFLVFTKIMKGGLTQYTEKINVFTFKQEIIFVVVVKPFFGEEKILLFVGSAYT